MSENLTPETKPVGESASYKDGSVAQFEENSLQDEPDMAESSMMRSSDAAPLRQEAAGGALPMSMDEIAPVPVPVVSMGTGALTQQIPIKAPQGRGGLSPNLALTYNSMKKNGIIGVGWGIEMGAISRSTRKGVHYDLNEFTALGNDLVQEGIDTNGNHWYRPEIESAFSKYIFLNNAGWIVISKDGKKYYFGRDTSSRQINKYGIFKWCLDKVEDTNGNTMEYIYTKNPNGSQDTGEIYIDEILYTNSDTSYFNKIKFYYQSRKDVPHNFVTHSKVVTSHRLFAIGTYAGSELTGVYKLQYNEILGSTLSSILSKIEIFGTNTKLDQDGNILSGTLLKTIRIKSQSSPIGTYSQKLTGAPTGIWDSNYAWTGDSNGDGRTDLMSFKNDRITTFHSNGDGTYETLTFDTPEYIWDSGIVWHGDFNGDGKQDLLSYKNAHFTTFFANGDGTFRYQYVSAPTGIWDSGYAWPGDANGDGKTDLLSFKNNRIVTLLSDGNGTYEARLFETPQYIWDSGLVWRGDFNGDGKQDLLSFKNATFTTFFAKGDGTYDWTNTSGPTGIWDSYYSWPGDYNGDGKTDLIGYKNGNFTTFFSSGDGTYHPITSSVPLYIWDTGHIWPGDYNGDGRTDLLSYKNGNFVTFISKGDGSFTVESNITPTDTWDANHAWAGDYNGDGKTDLLSHRNDNASFATISAEGPAPGLLKEIENGMGGKISVEYKCSTEYQNHKLPYVLHTVSQIESNDGFGNILTQEYTYSGGYQDYAEREFRGFDQVTLTTPEIKTENRYILGTEDAYDRFFRGKPLSIKSWDLHGNPVNETRFSWSKELLSLNEGSAFVKLDSKSTTLYDGLTTLTTTEEFTYSSENGEVIKATTSGPGPNNSDITVVTEKEYENIGDWVWRVKKETIKPLGGNALRSIEYGYQPETGNMLWNEAWLDGDANPRTTMTYDDYGNIISVTDPKGNVTTTSYDPLTHTYPVKVTTPITTNPVTQVLTGHVIEYLEYDYRFGTPKKVKDENNNITEFFFDEFGRTVRVDTPDGGQAVTIYYDNEFPKKIVTMVNESDTGADVWSDGYGGKEGYKGCIGRGIEAYQYIDGLGRSIQSVSFGENRKPIITKMSYDRMGRNHLVEGPFFGSGTGFPQTTPAETPYVKTIFDKRGRPIEMRSPIHSQTLAFDTAPAMSETVTMYSYNGLEATVTDPDGGKKTEIKDYLGRLVEVIEYADRDEEFHTKYFYNVAGDLLTVRDHLGNETTIQYDTLGRKISMDDPDMGEWSYTYDPNGNMISQTDAKDQRIELAYDEQGRVTRKSYSTGESDVVYTYDEGSIDGVTIENGIGSIYSVSNVDANGKGVKTTCDAFDTMGRLTKQTRNIDGKAYTTGYTFDITGKPETLTYPDQYVLKYDYHPGSGLLRLVFGLTDFHSYASYTNYDVTGKTGQAEVGNGTSTRYTYDPWSKRLIGYINADSTLEPGKYLQHKIYAYSKAGDIKSITDQKMNTTRNYTYDKLHRLISEKSTGDNTISGVTSLENTFNGDQLHAADTLTFNDSVFQFTYDENGNLTKGPDFSNPASVATREIEYNTANMPVTIKRNGTTVASFAYDGGATRYKKISGAIETLYVSGNYEVRNGTATKYIFGGSMRIARVSGNTVLYYHKDHLGSSVMITDENEQPVGGISEYNPFGMDRDPSAGDNKNYKFTDQEQDKETGLYNYDARLYDPVIGVFLSADTIVPDFSDPQSLNRYSYCRNNPIIYTDPSGHVFLVDDILIGAAVGAAIGGATSAAMGENIGQGMLTGAVGGAFFGGAGGIIAGAGITSTGAQVGLHAGAGAISGGINASITGGDIGLGMLVGGLSGGVGKYADPFMGNTFGSQLLGRTAISGLTGGISSELYGGTFAAGFKYGAKTGAIGFLCNDYIHNGMLYDDNGAMKGEVGLERPLITPLDALIMGRSLFRLVKMPFTLLAKNSYVFGNEIGAVGKITRKPGKLGQFKGSASLRAENKVVRDAAKQAGLNRAQRATLHREISGQGYGFSDILSIAQDIIKGLY